MKVEVLFGVRASSMEEANDLAESAIGEKSTGRENSNFGDYQIFGDHRAENVRVIQNEDMYDEMPCYEIAKAYKFVLLLEGAPLDSKYLAALEAHPENFVKLESKLY